MEPKAAEEQQNKHSQQEKQQQSGARQAKEASSLSAEPHQPEPPKAAAPEATTNEPKAEEPPKETAEAAATEAVETAKATEAPKAEVPEAATEAAEPKPPKAEASEAEPAEPAETEAETEQSEETRPQAISADVLKALVCGYDSDFAAPKEEVPLVTVSASDSPSPVLKGALIAGIAPLPADLKKEQEQEQEPAPEQQQEPEPAHPQQLEPVVLTFRRDDAVQGVVPLCIPRVLPVEAFLVRVEPALVPGGQEELVMLTGDTVELEVMVLPVSPLHAHFMNALRNAPSTLGAAAAAAAAAATAEEGSSDEEDEDDFDCRYVTYTAVLTVAGAACVLELGPVPPAPQ